MSDDVPMVHERVGCAALPLAMRQDWEQGCGVTAVPLACVYVQGEPAAQPSDNLVHARWACKAARTSVAYMYGELAVQPKDRLIACQAQPVVHPKDQLHACNLTLQGNQKILCLDPTFRHACNSFHLSG